MKRPWKSLKIELLWCHCRSSRSCISHMLHIHVTKQEMQHGQVSANASIVTPHSAHVLLRWEALCHIFGRRTPDENDFQKPVQEPQENNTPHLAAGSLLCKHWYGSTGKRNRSLYIDSHQKESEYLLTTPSGSRGFVVGVLGSHEAEVLQTKKNQVNTC